MAFELNDPARLAALAALGLGPDAKARDIISAYRRLARENHPDMYAGRPPDNSSFADISDAYHFLTRGARNRPTETPARAPDQRQAGSADAAPTFTEFAFTESPFTEPPFPGHPSTEPPFTGPTFTEPIFEAGPVIIRPLPPESR